MNRFAPSYCVFSFSFPTDTAAARSAGRKFIRAAKRLTQPKNLAANGRGWSLVCSTPERAEELLRPHVPADGTLEIFGVTDSQVSRGRNFWGARRTAEMYN